MRIGVVCALEREIGVIRERLGDVREHFVGGIRITEINLFSHTVLLTISGIGKVSAAMAAQALISKFDCEMLFNTGLAGGCDARLMPGDAVVADKVVYHDFDLGISEIFREIKNGFFPDEKLAKLASRVLEQTGVRAVRGTVATGDVFVENRAVKAEIIERTGCGCVDMEAAAIAHVASVNRLPFASVKVISDSADENAAGDFEFSVEAYAERCASLIYEMARHL